MILNEETIKLAKTCGFDSFTGEKDDGTQTDYWECWEEQLIAFAQKIYQMGYDDGCYETSHYTGHTGLFGEPQ
jgi:hypothetical protein